MFLINKINKINYRSLVTLDIYQLLSKILFSISFSILKRRWSVIDSKISLISNEESQEQFSFKIFSNFPSLFSIKVIKLFLL